MKFTTKPGLFSALLLLPAVWAALALAVNSVPADPVLDYYWQKAREAAPRFDPNVPGVSYRLTARTFRHSVTEGGRISRTDTVSHILYFTAGALDSAIVIHGGDREAEPPDLSYPAIFDQDNLPHLFPNDTGGVDLPIGFLADSAHHELPDGLAVIDRYGYQLRSLYLCYPHKKDFRRYSRSFRFVLVDGYLFPDSVWQVATELGIFFSESYRIETGIADIRVQSLSGQPEL